MSRWLDPEDVENAALLKVGEIRDFARSRAASLGGLDKAWWSHSLGLEFSTKDRATYYVVSHSHYSVGNSQLEEFEVVPWTHWVGRAVLLVKAAVEKNGKYPATLRCGGFGAERERPIGPWVSYRFEDGILREHSFHSREAQTIATDDPAADREPLVAEGFGLREIVDRRDLSQDDAIRLPMHGIHVLTGGPGVGKTTVALHRIVYLLDEQAGYLRVHEPKVSQQFFSPKDMQVVVWEEHLVPYLQRCLAELGKTEVPVRHIEDWVARTLRGYLRFGRGDRDYRFEEADEWSEAVKLGQSIAGRDGWRGISEDHMQTFLFGRDSQGSPNWSVARDLLASIQMHEEQLRAELGGSDSVVGASELTVGFEPSLKWIQSLKERLQRRIEEALRRANEIANSLSLSHNPTNKRQSKEARDEAERLARAQDMVDRATQRLESKLKVDYGSVLSEFYRSDVLERLLVPHYGQQGHARFLGVQADRSRQRSLTRADRYLLLWVVHFLTRDSRATKAGSPLPTFSHMVVDEAQYYAPIMLRLLASLCRQPLGSMTVVGDLQQKVKSEGGLVGWDDMKSEESKVAIHTLVVNYRWSKPVFDFLQCFHDAAGLADTLVAPRHWPIKDDESPTIVVHEAVAEEDLWLVDHVSQVRQDRNWSLAVVVPSLEDPRWPAVVEELAKVNVRARCASGEDVRECEEKVVFTNYESIVGLEFDAVFLPGMQEVVGSGSQPVGEAACSRAWVAMTRAKRFLSVGYVGDCALLRGAAFDRFR